jgi:hypothetical protein
MQPCIATIDATIAIQGMFKHLEKQTLVPDQSSILTPVQSENTALDETKQTPECASTVHTRPHVLPC